MGHTPNLEFIKLLKSKIIESYCIGNYVALDHSYFGFKINILIDMPGANEKAEKIYKIKSNFMVFPNGKLKCNTLIGGWQ